MKLSATWFLSTLSTEMWIASIIAYFGVFLGFFLTVFLYRKYRKITASQDSSLGDVFMYMWTFIAAQGVELRWSKHAFWKVQVVNFAFLHIIVATGFSTFMTTLLSTKYYEMPFHELEDFARIRSHTICVLPLSATRKYFGTITDIKKIDLLEKWNGIVNKDICNPFFSFDDQKDKNLEDLICQTEGKVAFVLSTGNADDK